MHGFRAVWSSRCPRRLFAHGFSSRLDISPADPLILTIPDAPILPERAPKAVKKSKKALEQAQKQSRSVLNALKKKSDSKQENKSKRDEAQAKKKSSTKHDDDEARIFLTDPVSAPPEVPVPYSRKIEGLLEETGSNTVLEDVPPPSEQKPIPTLAHGLDRVLFNPGVHWLRDPRSRVYNFPPMLEEIPKVTDFAFDRLPGFVKSSRDEDLWSLAKSENRRFAGSTSSLSGMLSHIYFMLSNNKWVDIAPLSLAFKREPVTFTPGQRMPASVVFNYKDGVYAIDSDSSKGAEDKNILLWLGTLLEKYLTLPPEVFSQYLRSQHPPQPSDDTRKEAYRYAKSRSFVMRSQLDCHDSRLPGTGVFDIKTRACLPIRMDLLNFEENSGYLIRSQYGKIESFEREYFDLVRSAFLKYSFQARIGNMDGVIVAYHNTARLFGFQYVPLQEMDERLFGSLPGTGDRVFAKCISLLELIADEIALCFPKESVKATFETDEQEAHLRIFVEPVEWENSEPPIKLLEVSSTSYLANMRVKPERAFGEIEEPWTVHYSVTHHVGYQDAIRRRLAETRERQFRAWFIPSGVPLDKIQAFWKALNFGGKSEEELENLGLPSSDDFQHPDFAIRELRNLARAGRADTERLAQDEAGKPKVVWGQTTAEQGLPLDPTAVVSSQENAEVVEAAAEDVFNTDILNGLAEEGHDSDEFRSIEDAPQEFDRAGMQSEQIDNINVMVDAVEDAIEGDEPATEENHASGQDGSNISVEKQS